MEKEPKFTPKEKIKLEVEEKIEKSESILTIEDIQFVFKELLKIKEYETTRQLEDEKGLYLWEIKIPEPKGNGHIEYSYMRKGEYPRGGSSSLTAVHETFFDKEGNAFSGGSVAKYENGEWRLTP